MEGGLKVPLHHPWAGVELVGGASQKGLSLKAPLQALVNSQVNIRGYVEHSGRMPGPQANLFILKTEKGDMNNPSVPNELIKWSLTPLVKPG